MLLCVGITNGHKENSERKRCANRQGVAKGWGDAQGTKSNQVQKRI